MTATNMQACIEGILFASGDPIEISRIAAVLGTGEKTVVSEIEALSERYASEKRGIRIIRLENAYQMCSSPEFADIIRLALEKGKPPRLSAQALETLSIVAYYQPVTRSYIEQVRGVDCTNTIGVLITRGLIEKHGYLAVPGRPSLYRTTDEFLRTFAISSLSELPPLKPPESSDPGGGMIDEQLILADFQVG